MRSIPVTPNPQELEREANERFQTSLNHSWPKTNLQIVVFLMPSPAQRDSAVEMPSVEAT